MELDKHYSPQKTEDKWYAFWMENNYFDSVPDGREPYTIVIPPPNVTGVLHMGHMLNNTIQDVLIRKARMEGKNACWVPGTDHASIATEAKVVKMLAEKGISKKDITREEFLNHAWEWKEKYGGIILEQLKKLGASCDWKRTRFTMENDMSEAVIDVFIDLYKKGYIYRGTKMVNWDPVGLTTLSDEEVIFKENNSQLVYILYSFSEKTKAEIGGDSKGLMVATTRPETIMGDVAICVHPHDTRYQHLIGKTVVVPLVNREIKIISDDYIDMEFGTGCLKVTPAHDENDYKIGKKHNLEVIDVLTDEGKIHECAKIYVGLDRFDCRKKIIKDLEEGGFLEKTEAIKNTVGHSERTDAVIEKKISTQWFVDMQKFMADYPEVLGAVLNDDIQFYPSKFKNVYKHWLENIKDWNISRQLWWGQRIPAWYAKNGEFVIAKTEQEAIIEFSKKGIAVSSSEIKQDEDVLDTWFSSWLWPISVFDGFKDTESNQSDYYFPTNDLVTGPDIIFFWVARMVMAGYAFKGKQPFKNVYFTGIVRDKQRRKMSKSLGNSPDPLNLIAQYGADATRMGLLLSAPAGNDILYDETQVEQGRNFCNKIWNAFKLINAWETADKNQFAAEVKDADKLANQWFVSKYQNTVNQSLDLYKEYRLSDVLMGIYKLVWDDFCSNYLEMIKPPFGEKINDATKKDAIENFHLILTLLHPFMPFITEELNLLLKKDNNYQPIIISKYPEYKALENNIDDSALAIVGEIRNIRNNKGLSPKIAFDLIINTNKIDNYQQFDFIVKKLANIAKIEFGNNKPEKCLTFMIGTDEIYVPFEETINKEEEQEKIETEIAYLEGFLISVDKKLSNEKFIANANPDVIEKEKQKQADALEKIKKLKGSIQ